MRAPREHSSPLCGDLKWKEWGGAGVGARRGNNQVEQGKF